MSPTTELRFVKRVVPYPHDPAIGRGVLILQQKWVHHHIPAGQTEAATEWRDVPAVEEQP